MDVAVSSPDRARLYEQLQEKIAEAAPRLKVPGVAVGVYLDGVEEYLYYGVTSMTNPLPVDEGTFFQIGSTGKTYTATVLMILVEQGLVDLDAPVRTYIPELKLKDASVAERVTVLQLLNHSAGWAGDIMRDTGDGDDALARYVVELATVDQVHPLGSIASYNNAAVNLAGRVIEKVTGKTYETAVHDLLLAPLGLDESFFFVRDIITRRFVVGHEEKDGETRVALPWCLPRNSNPAGGIVATARDQIRYARFHLGNGAGMNDVHVLSAMSLKRMQTPTISFGSGFVGISWMLEDVEGVRTVRHGGSTPGQQAELLLVPERQFAITVLTNASSGAQLHRELVEWALEAYLGVALPEEAPLTLDAEELAVYAGSYDGFLWIADLTVEEDHLRLILRFTDKGIEEVRAAGMDPPSWAPSQMKILPRDRFLIVDGEYGGLKGNFVRQGDAITAIDLGRVAPRR